MSYLVLARKYRPRSFGEMTGQEHVVRTLSNALRTGQLAHAFLFTGPRGVGKTTSARLVAKALNCERGPTAEPCGACAPCVEIAEGRAVDVVEIDAASNNGVDNVRDIVEAVKYRPARDRFKVFVVDEVHMLSMGAFNALLKTLEEPPPHVKFVLATTDVHRVPETIVSRCQRFDFRRLTQRQIVDQLRKVAAAEGMTVSEGALALVARAAEGGMRDALSMLDQVRAACGDAADDAAVAEAIGAVDAGAVARLGAALVRRDGAAVLTEIEALFARGQEMKRVAEELVRHLRNLVVVKLVPAAPLDLPDAERREVVAQAEAASAPQLARLFDLAQAAVNEVKESEQPRYALDVALLKACFLAPGADVQDLVARLERLGGAPPSGRPGRDDGRGTSARGEPAAGRGEAPGGSAATAPAGGVRRLASFGTPGCAAGNDPAGGARPAEPARAPGAAEAVRRPAPSSGSGAPCARDGEAGADPVAPAEAVWGVGAAEAPSPGLAPGASAPSPAAAPRSPLARRDDPALPAADRWRLLVAGIEAASPTVGNALKQATLLALRDGEVSVRLPPGFLASTVERRRAEVESAFASFFGRPTRLAVVQGAPAPEAPAPAAAPLAQVEQAERAARSARVRESARSNPNLQEAVRVLEGEIVKIEEL